MKKLTEKEKRKARYFKLSSHVIEAIRLHNLKELNDSVKYINCSLKEIYELKINRDENIQKALEENVRKG